MKRLVILGMGYSGRAIAAAAREAGFSVIGTTRDPSAWRHGGDAPAPIAFDDAGPEIARATHLVSSVPPGAEGDPALARHGDAIAHAACLGWIGYLSTTGVYGDRQGGWVDEATTPDPASARAGRRIAAEADWSALARPGRAVDLIRLAGIYGPGRSVFDDLLAGNSRPIVAPGHCFGRIHRDDIANGVLAAIASSKAAEAGDGRSARVLNFSDDLPAESAAVIAFAASLLGIAAPVPRPLAEAWPDMSPMARSFWSDNRRVRSQATQAILGRPWHYPTYREGLLQVRREEQLVDRGRDDQQV